MFVAALFEILKSIDSFPKNQVDFWVIWKHKQANYRLRMWTVRGLICDNVVQMKNMQKVHRDF